MIMRRNIDASEFYLYEALGKQKKEWVVLDNELYLFKIATIRKDGSSVYNDVSECIASDVGKLLDIPVAEYNLCVKNGKKGVISKNFLNNESSPKRYELVDGVSLIRMIDPGFKNMQLLNPDTHQLYTVSLLLESVGKYGLIKEALEMIVFDALIANRDRNPSNYGIINDLQTGTHTFSPLYDSCTSFGMSMGDERLDKCISLRTLEINDEMLNVVIHKHITSKLTIERSLQYKEKRTWDNHQITKILSEIHTEKKQLEALVEKRMLSISEYHKRLKNIEKKYKKFDVTTVTYQPLIEYLTTFYPNEIKDIMSKIKENITLESITGILNTYVDEIPTERLIFAEELVLRRAEWMVNYFEQNFEIGGKSI